ncbi:MAG: hypothetical protein IJU04_04150 [Ruminococcus sp.]|nr:hypothetical protein [Ruminococcus sp.]
MNFLGYLSKEYKDERGREYYFDNAKFILITFVVLAHAISPLKSTMNTAKTIWTVINTLHMPCLILISGYFGKSYIKNGVVKTQRLVTYVVYYLAAQIAVSLFEYFVLGYKDMSKSFIAPRSSLWYLLCLIIWFLVLPYVSKLQPKYLIPAAFLMALVIGYDTKATKATDLLSITRAFNHFPFFLIGYYFKKEWLYKFRNKATQIASIIIIAGVTIWTYFNLDVIPSRIITCDFNYPNSELKVLNQVPIMFVNRILFYFFALLLCACFMLLVPRGKAFFTKWGSRTLQVYILHRFLYLSELEYKWYEPFLSLKGLVAMSAIAIALTIILALKPFEIPFKLLSKIKLTRFEKPDAQEVKA